MFDQLFKPMKRVCEVVALIYFCCVLCPPTVPREYATEWIQAIVIAAGEGGAPTSLDTVAVKGLLYKAYDFLGHFVAPCGLDNLTNPIADPIGELLNIIKLKSVSRTCFGFLCW